MARHSFGEPISDDDILEIQGVEYPMVPLGMRAMRRMLNMQKQLPERAEGEITEEDLDLAVTVITDSVRPDARQKLRDHIEDSVPPNLLMGIATAVMRSFSDVDPTQPGSSSAGSTPTGSASTAGAPLAPPTSAS